MHQNLRDPAYANLKVLLVDDEPYMRKVVRALLYGIGISAVAEAGDGSAALQQLEQQPADLVILDWDMPFVSGLEFMRIVRNPDAFSLHTIPVLMLTGHGSKQRVLQAINAGVNEFLLKPVSTKQLADRINSIIKRPRKFVRDANYYGPERRVMAQLDDRISEIITARRMTDNSPPLANAVTAQAPAKAQVESEAICGHREAAQRVGAPFNGQLSSIPLSKRTDKDPDEANIVLI